MNERSVMGTHEHNNRVLDTTRWSLVNEISQVVKADSERFVLTVHLGAPPRILNAVQPANSATDAPSRLNVLLEMQHDIAEDYATANHIAH